MFVDIVIVFIL